MMTSLILFIPEAAKLLGITESALRMLVFKKQIPHHRWGRRVFFLRDELEEFLRLLGGTSIEEALQHVESST